MKQPYPLSSLLEIRASHVDACKDAVRAAADECERCETEVREAQGKVSRFEQDTRAFKESMRKEASWDVREGQNNALYLKARDVQRQSLVDGLRRVQQALRESESRLESAREELALARAEHEAVVKHQAAFEAQRALQVEKAQENEVDERSAAAHARRTK